MSSEVDELDLDSSNNATNSVNAAKFSFTRHVAAKPKYGIDKAITLVRSLQKHKINPKVIAGIMKQTLESVDIRFSEIITDAKRKESSIQHENGQKDKQVEEMKRKFEALKEEKIKLQQDLDETKSVRKFLQQAINEERPKQSVTVPQQTSVNTDRQQDNIEDEQAIAS